MRLFDEQGAPGWADAARAELERVGARRPSSPGRLTTTERRVADLAVQGLANKEIARTLVVTVNTVEFHLRNTYTKLGIRSRMELAPRLADLDDTGHLSRPRGCQLGLFPGSFPRVFRSFGTPSRASTVESWPSTSSSSTSHRATTPSRSTTSRWRSGPAPT